MMNFKKKAIFLFVLILMNAAMVFAAYHHEGEKDADKFLTAHPDKAGTKLDHCALCHCGGEYESKGQMVALGSCQWCHYTYGYDGAGEIEETMNEYGIAYKNAGRNAAAVTSIDGADSDGDGYTNIEEIEAETFPGNPDDHPGLTEAPYRIYTKDQLEAMTQHTEFLLMNTSRSGDFYAEYTGVPMKELLDDAGILSSATEIIVYAPDGWSQTHPLYYNESIEMYHVYGSMPGRTWQYPSASYYYNDQADIAKNTIDGWCDYSAPSCVGRSHGDPIPVVGGLKAILAYKREGIYMDPGILTEENKLDGEGPFRVVVPQKYPNAPDQSSKASNQDVKWPYKEDWDHNAGACTRTVTIIKVEPMPEGTTDIDVLEAGWNYVDQEKIIIYGAIDGTDSNGNGILDSEEGTQETSDYDDDGVADYKDTDTARFRQPNGLNTILLHCEKGSFADVSALTDDDPTLSQNGKPAVVFPYGAIRFSITGISPGGSVDVTMVFPENVVEYSKFYKITSTGWQEIKFGSNNGDNVITVKFKDGDPATDGDGIANGVIVDPGALGVPEEEPEEDDDDDDDSCFIMTLTN
ncbi:MAG: hypothetical protein MUE70_05250 [Desulfobacterales bacterium]|jgi:hypothetical protein|nr:hypothetical protein [Desulfobacterales bacterium]